MDIRMRWTGVREIDNVIRGLPLQMNHKVHQAAHMSASKVLVDAEKLSAPEGPTGNLVDSIGVVKTSFSKASALGEINVGPRRGRFKGYAAHLVEYGTGPRAYKGANRGVMPKKPFALPSWTRKKTRVQEGIRVHLGRHVLAFMKRTIKRHG